MKVDYIRFKTKLAAIEWAKAKNMVIIDMTELKYGGFGVKMIHKMNKEKYSGGIN